MEAKIWPILLFFFLSNCSTADKKYVPPKELSGVYPHLAYYNDEGECGTGAVVPWGDCLWFITYGPHLPYGSSDKLYQITPGLKQIVRKESTGGTPANRLIHKESNQLFIGPYAVSETGDVRTIPYTSAPGRYTGNARHLTDPANRIYIGTMEEGFYEINVHSLSVKELYKDGNELRKEHKETGVNPPNDLLKGAHGKGLYSGQGVLVYSNNGEATQEALEKFDVESGSLSEWDGESWTLVRRNQFVEVTGPGGIYGNSHPDTDPIWTTGWDHKSILLGVRDAKKGWAFFRLPKGSHSYDGAHGWNTEWPRIRDTGTKEAPDYLMTMHGLFWRFPPTFTVDNTAGIRPRSAYLKVIGDYTRWNDRLVFGCDDSAQKEFLNKRKAKGSIEGPGQSNSNLWFTSLSKPDELGPATATGSVWANEPVKGNDYSDPFLFCGWAQRNGWIKNESKNTVTFTFEVDKKGTNSWVELTTIAVEGYKTATIPFSDADQGEWIRVKTDKNTVATVTFSYTSSDSRSIIPDSAFKGLSAAGIQTSTGGLLYGLGDNRRALGVLATDYANGETTETGYYEMGENLELVRKEDAKTADYIREKIAIPYPVITIDSGSVRIIDDKNRKWRLPIHNKDLAKATHQGVLRVCREVATERDLVNCMGTFYELPAENADGYAKIRPVSSHNFCINDFASYRGMLILTGIALEECGENQHIIVADDKKAAVWAGVIDDLWTLGKPIGVGGPWVNTDVKKNKMSDPYLIAFYDEKTLTLSHKGDKPVRFSIEVDPTGNGDWMEYRTCIVEAGKQVTHKFPESFQARWIRFSTDADVRATAWLEYK